MTLRVLIYQRDDYDKMFIRADGIQDELGDSTGDGVKFRVAVQFSAKCQATDQPSDSSLKSGLFTGILVNKVTTIMKRATGWLVGRMWKTQYNPILICAALPDNFTP